MYVCMYVCIMYIVCIACLFSDIKCLGFFYNTIHQKHSFNGDLWFRRFKSTGLPMMCLLFNVIFEALFTVFAILSFQTHISAKGRENI